MGKTERFATAEFRREVQAQGMQLDEVMLARADKVCTDIGLNEAQLKAVYGLHLGGVKRLFDRKLYGWRSRLAVALYFLGFGHRIDSDAA